jgi:hypothetical protein
VLRQVVHRVVLTCRSVGKVFFLIMCGFGFTSFDTVLAGVSEIGSVEALHDKGGLGTVLERALAAVLVSVWSLFLAKIACRFSPGVNSVVF